MVFLADRVMPSNRLDQDPAIDALPAAYADWRRSTLGRITDKLEEKLLLDRIGPARGLRILDVGCGDGILATTLAAAGAQVTGLDASADRLAAARRRADAANVALEFVEGEAERLSFPDGSFDVVLSVATLCFSSDPDQPVWEMVRVLRPGGRLVLGELGRWNTWATLRRVKGWLGSSVWRAARFRTRRELRALVQHAGLHEISVTGAIFYPPVGFAARAFEPVDASIGRRTAMGAAFLVLQATKPLENKAEEQTERPIL